MGLQAVQIVVVEDLDCGVLDGAVHSFDLAVIRYEIRRRLVVPAVSERETGDMVSPSGTQGKPGARRCGQARR